MCNPRVCKHMGVRIHDAIIGVPRIFSCFEWISRAIPLTGRRYYAGKLLVRRDFNNEVLP